MKSIGSTVLLAFVVQSSASCVDLQAGCLPHWCGNDYWASQCEETCGLCTPEEVTSEEVASDCVDIQAGCQTHWCGDVYWNSQCQRTCHSCSSSDTMSPTSRPTTQPTPTPQPTRQTSNPTRPTPAPSSTSPTPSIPTPSPSTPRTPTPQPTRQTSNPTSPTPAPSSTSSPSKSSTKSPTYTPSQEGGIPVENVTGKKYVMYYPAWATYARDFQVTDIDASKLTHINYAFANIANGECVLGDAYADTQKFFAETDSWNDPADTLKGNFNQLHELKRKFPHVVNMISLGGWTWSTHFSDIASTTEKREKFAASCVDYMQQYGFDGIDIDWEYPVSGGNNIPNSPDDRINFTLLLKAFRNALNAAGSGVHYPLTIATSADPAKTDTSYDVPAISPLLDFVNVMTYDFNGSWNDRTGHNAPLYANQADSKNPEFNVDAAVNAFLSSGLPKEKLILGLGFYGRGWSNVQASSGETGLFAPANGPSPGTWEAGVLDYSDLVENYINKNGYTRYWDSVSKVPYLFNPATKVFISYDDQESICYKVQYAMEKDLGGGMVWEVTSDYNKSLQQLSYDVLVGGADTCTF